MSNQPKNDDEPPEHQELARQLRRLMTKGLPAAQEKDVETLLSLHAVRALVLVDLPSARLAALRERITELTRGTRDERLRRLAPYAFGTYSVESHPLEVRLDHAAQQADIGLGREALRKTYLDRLASDFADRLLWLEHRLRYNSWLERPFDEALHDETLRRYDFYTAMAFWLNGAALDVEAALDLDSSEAEFHGYAHSALWRWTKFLRSAHRYDDEFFGNWALAVSGAPVEEAVRSEYDAQAVPPLLPRDRSWLRVELLTAFHEELDPFISLLERQERGQEILKTWSTWLRSCACDRDDPQPEHCSVDRFIAEAQTFYEIMNEEISEPHRTDRAARFRTLPDIIEP